MAGTYRSERTLSEHLRAPRPVPDLGEYEGASEKQVETCLRVRTGISTDADDLVAKAIGRSSWMVSDECLDELAQSWL
jgi:hypothetical protein